MKQKVYPFLKKIHKKDSTGHDIFHLQRVVNMSQYINLKEGGDLKIITLSAWLHDIGDYKLHNGIDKTEPLINDFFNQNQDLMALKNPVLKVINQVSFKGGFNEKPTTLEAEIVQDADRLDALGAIGIARTFAYGGLKGSLIFDGSSDFISSQSFEDYKKSKGSTLAHFYDKLLKLKDLMNTKTAKDIAEIRHKRLLTFLDNFYDEWNFNSKN